MKIIKEKLSNGNTIKYKQLENGTCYHLKTDNSLVEVLENARYNQNRIRIWLGEKGKSWDEENDIIGYIGRSTGNIKIPLLINNSRSLGGGGLLDHCIVKVVCISTKRILWKHKNFSQGKFVYKNNKVFRNNKEYAPNCKNKEQAKRLCNFMNGIKNSK